MLTALQQQRLAARPCGCGEATLDQIGNVVRVKSCPACALDALDYLRRVCYDPVREGNLSGERQLDLFDVDPSASDLNGIPF